jgi:acyl carrier protein
MNESDMELLLLRIAETLHVDVGVLNINSSTMNVSEWDSLGILELMSMLSTSYNIAVDAGESHSCSSVKGLIEILDNRQAKG